MNSMMKRLFYGMGIVLGVVLLFSIFINTSSVRASAQLESQAEDALPEEVVAELEAQLTTFFTELTRAKNGLLGAEEGLEIANTAVYDTPNIQTQLDQLTDTDWVAIQEMVTQNPDWLEIPTMLQSIADNRTATSVNAHEIGQSGCQSDFSLRDLFIAKQAVILAELAKEIWSNPITVAVWFAAKETLIYVEHKRAEFTSCLNQYHRNASALRDVNVQVERLHSSEEFLVTTTIAGIPVEVEFDAIAVLDQKTTLPDDVMHDAKITKIEDGVYVVLVNLTGTERRSRFIRFQVKAVGELDYFGTAVYQFRK